MPSAIYSKDGKFLRTIEDDDADKTLRDGEVLRVRSTLMDSADPLQRAIMQDAAPSQPAPMLHRPGFVMADSSSQVEREVLYARRDKRLQDAYRNPPALDPAMSAAPARVQTADAREDAYRNYQNRLERAYLQP